MKHFGLLLILILLAIPSSAALQPLATPVYDGPELDYQPAPLRVTPGGELMLIIERLNPSTLSGDLYQTRSVDNGLNWSEPQAIITTTLNERHPALVQLAPQSFALFYLAGSGSSFRIQRATSSDGVSWTAHGAIDLGWASSGEINPAVVRAPDGRLTLVYQYLPTGRSYISQSIDDGVTWDTSKTPLHTSGALLPRIAFRPSDGRYLAVYQVNPGNNQLQLYTKITSDPLDWSAAPVPLDSEANAHDAQPILLPDGRFLIAYIRQSMSQPFNVLYRLSPDGEHWSAATPVTADIDHGNVQPHPLPDTIPGQVLLFWSHEQGGSDQDILQTTLALPSSVYLPFIQRQE